MPMWLSDSVRVWWNQHRRSARRTSPTRVSSRRARLELLESRVLLTTLNGHTILLDGSGKIVPWDTASPNAYDSYLDKAWNFIKTQVPNSPGSPPISNYPQYYFYDGFATTTPAITPDTAMNDIGEKIPNWVESGRLYYAYTGDTSVMDIVRGLVDYTIAHGTSPSNFTWPNFPHTTNNAGQAEFTGYTGQFALHEIQVDHGAEMGLAYYRMYQFYRDQKYLTAAVNVADVLAAHARVGTVTQSVWPYRVKLDSGAITAQYGANWAGAYSLLTELVAANIGNVSAYAAAASKARNFILNVPMQTLLDTGGNMAGNWTDGHSDNPVNSNTYKSNLSNSNMALYILEHPEFDPNWQTDVPNMIQWTERWFVTRTVGGEPATSYGANVVGEQDAFNYKMVYQTARYAAECALWYRASGDASYLEKAYRSLNWVTYGSDSNGRATECPYTTWIATWWSDNYGEGPRMFYQAFAAMPEWAPAGENHLLYSEDVVRNVSYATNSVAYTAASGDGIEYLRVKFLPDTVTVGGVALPLRSDISAQGYTLRSLAGGDFALTIRRTGPVTTAATVSIGRGGGQLIIDGATLRIDRPNAISDNTSVTIRGNGTLDLGGYAETVAALTLESGTLINGVLNASSYMILSGAITATLGPGPIVKQTTSSATVNTPTNATTVSVQSGQLTVSSIVADTLSIGAAFSAAIAEPVRENAGASQATTSVPSSATSPNPVNLQPASASVTPLGAVVAPVIPTVSDPPPVTPATRPVASSPQDIQSLSASTPTPAIANAAMARTRSALPLAAVIPETTRTPAATDRRAIVVRAASLPRPVVESPTLDRLTLLLATERSVARLTARRQLRTLDAALTEGVSPLSDSPDLYGPNTPVRRRMRWLSESRADAPTNVHVIPHLGP
jgi:hypothetical protein